MERFDESAIDWVAAVTIKLDGTLRLTEDCDKNVRFEVLGYGWEE